ncbi:MAG: single-stranded-DNA-specific exonuclease RecJ [bacterium]
MKPILADHHWHLPPPPTPELRSLACAAQIPPLVATLLYHRGCHTIEEMKEFLNPSPARLNRPDTLPDINIATERTLSAVEKKEPILIYGDYDVDGICGTAILQQVLKNLGARVFYYLPHRHTEGYGISPGGIEFAIKNNIRLIITNDCGSADIEPISTAQNAGIDIIVTDHHEPGVTPPPALAFVNPKRPDSTYPFRELAGVGVAFKFVWSILTALNRPKEDLTALLDLVGLGTIADVVPLIGENRIIARLGLTALSRSRRPGIRALLEVSRLNQKPLTARVISFGLAPRINAAGRIGHASTALELLLTEDKKIASDLASELEQLNRTRQEIEENIIADALNVIETERKHECRVMVLARAGWNEGVIGIVAAKLVDRFWRPCIMISLRDELGKGSARSISGFNLYQALLATQSYLRAFGGHRYAAGLQISREQIVPFDEAINQFASDMPAEIFHPTLHIEAQTDLGEITHELLNYLISLQPFGPENPEPILTSTGLEVVGYPRRVGKERQHLKFKVRSGATILPAIAWDRSDEILNLQIGQPNHLDICYTLTADSFNGRNQLQLNILDLRSRPSKLEDLSRKCSEAGLLLPTDKIKKL